MGGTGSCGCREHQRTSENDQDKILCNNPPPILGPIPEPIPHSPDESQEVHSNMDWHLAWVKEIGHLQQIADEQERAGADQEWYWMMLFHVQSGFRFS